MRLDILAIGAHPDDVEMSCGGSLIKHIKLGNAVGILNLTLGQLSSRGTVKNRLEETSKACRIIGAHNLPNLKFEDGFFNNNKAHQMSIIKAIRRYKPKVVLCNAPSDRHPDHGKAAELVKHACFLSGLHKVDTVFNGKKQVHHRPKHMFHYIQDYYLTPSFVIDITPYMPKKIEAIKAYHSQFYDPNSNEINTPISSKAFFEFLVARSREFGRVLQCEFAEGFISPRPIGVSTLNELL